MKIISLFIERPVACFMAMLILVFLGLVSFFLLPVNLFPSIARPVLRVETKCEGRGPLEIENEITRHLEEELSLVENLVKMTSLSGDEKSFVYLTFRWGTNMDVAALDVREKIDKVNQKLPHDVKTPIVERFNPVSQPILIMNLTSEESSLTELKSETSEHLKPHLERIEGVSSVSIFGGDENEIVVNISTTTLKAYQLTLEDIVSTLKKENIEQSGGFIEEGKTQFLIKSSGRFKNLEDIKKVIITPKPGVFIHLGDIAEVQLSKKKLIEESRFNGKRAIELAVFKNPEGNTLQIIKHVKKFFADNQALQKWNTNISYDQSSFIQNATSLIKGNAILGGFLTILILFFFLRKLIPTLVVAISIPTSIICSFALMKFFGMSLNIFSFVGLALAIGMVVDATIVVIESIDYHLNLGKNPKVAALEGTMEVGIANIASTLTTLVVFVPLLFIRGEIGLIFKELSLSIVFALLFSLLVSLFIVPMLCAQFQRQQKKETITKEEFVAKAFWWKKLADRFFIERIWNFYERVLRRFLLPNFLHPAAIETRKQIDHLYDVTVLKAAETIEQQKKIFEKASIFVNEYRLQLDKTLLSFKKQLGTILVFVVAFVFSFLIFPDREFLPQVPEKNYQIHFAFLQPLSTSAVSGLMSDIEKKMKHPQIVNILTKYQASRAHIFFELKKAKKSKEVLSYLYEELSQFPEVEFSITKLSPILDLTGGFNQQEIDIEVSGPDIVKLQVESEKMTHKMRELNFFSKIYYPHGEKISEIKLEFNRYRLSDFGLTIQEVSRYIEATLKGEFVTTVRQEGRSIDLLVLQNSPPVKTLSQLKDIIVPTSQGSFIPISSLMNFEETQNLALIERSEKQRIFRIHAQIAPSFNLSSVVSTLSTEGGGGVLDKVDLSPNYHWKFGDQDKSLRASFKDLGFALIVAIVLMYMIMAALFESLLYPFTILFTVPMGIIGIAFSLQFFGLKLSLIAFIGVIVLMGIIVNNAIILIACINSLRRMGLDRKEAVLQASQRRLRPILMTSLTTVLGAIPLALGIGTGAAFYQPLAVVIVGGLTVGTVLTLFFIPIFYCIFDDLGEIIRFAFLKKKMQILHAMKSDKD